MIQCLEIAVVNIESYLKSQLKPVRGRNKRVVAFSDGHGALHNNIHKYPFLHKETDTLASFELNHCERQTNRQERSLD